MFYSYFQSQQTLKKFETFEEIIATPDIYEEYSNDSFVIDQDHKEFEFSNPPPILNEKKTNPNLDEEISFSCRQCYKSFEEPRFLILHISTGKSLSEALLFAEHGENMLCTKIVLNVRNNFCTQHVLPTHSYFRMF